MRIEQWFGVSLLAAGMGAGAAFAQESGSLPRPDDFAYGFEVQPGGPGPLFELSVPDDLYRSVYRPDLGDLRVFNASGGLVAHEIGSAGSAEAQRPPSRLLPVFPIYEETTGGAGGGIRIVTDARGAIIEATPGRVSGGAGTRVVAYVVDLGVEPGSPEHLLLDWEDAVGGGFAVALDVASSGDLATWQTRVRDVTVADLRSGDAELVNRTIELPSDLDRYLRVEWPAALEDVRLESAAIDFRPTSEPVTRRMLTIPGVRAAPRDETIGYLFDTGGFWPVDRVRLVYPEGNVVTSGTLFSRATAEENWRVRYSGTWYRLERDGAVVESAPASLSVSSDRYWRFEPAEGADAEGEGALLEIGWVPHRLTFVAQGDPPFTVAFGSAIAEPVSDAAGTLRGLARSSGVADGGTRLVSPASVSDLLTLGGASRLEPSEPPLRWRVWVLWGLLGSGVALLAWMVWRLARQMNA